MILIPLGNEQREQGSFSFVVDSHRIDLLFEVRRRERKRFVFFKRFYYAQRKYLEEKST